MGNAGSSSREGGRNTGYGPPLPGHVVPNPHYDPRYYGGDPYSYGNPLPLPPKEPLPQGPFHGYHTPLFAPEEIRERAPHDRSASIGRKRGNTILKSLNGLGKKIAGSSGAGRNDPDNVWTYPDGKTPFPIKKAELSPHIRPARFRSSSFSGRDKKTDREYLWAGALGYGDSQLPRRRSLNRTPQRLGGELLPQPQRTNQSQYLWPESHRKDGYFDPPPGGAQPRFRRALSETRDRRPRGVSIDGYIPPERRDRSWEYPDGTPWLRVAQISPSQPAVNPPGITPMATAGALPRPPSPINVHPSARTGDVVFPGSSQPIASTSAAPMNLPAAGPSNENRRRSRNSQLQPQPTGGDFPVDDPMHPLYQSVPGLSNYLNTEVSFSCDRNHPLMLYSYHGVVYGSKLYPSAFHLWAAMKYMDRAPEFAKKIRKTSLVKDVLKLIDEARMNGARQDWGQVQWQLLDEVNHIKCKQHSQVLTDLLATEHRHIVFLSQREPEFGFSTLDQTGANQQGRSLERVRERLYAEGVEVPPYPPWKVEEIERMRSRQF